MICQTGSCIRNTKNKDLTSMPEVGDGQVLVLLLEDFQAFDAYKVAATPTTILIDGKGVIAWMKEGQIDEQSLRDALRAIAAEED